MDYQYQQYWPETGDYSTLCEILRRQLRLSDPLARQYALEEAFRVRGETYLEGLSLGGCNLSNVILPRIILEEVDFRDTSCQQMILPTLENCCWDGVDASYSNFCKLYNCSFKGSRLTGSRIFNRFSDCDFTEAELESVFISPMSPKQYRECVNNRFCRANLKFLNGAGAYFASADFEGATFERARLSRADFSGARLNAVDFSGANLIHATFDGADLEGVVFDRCLVTEELAGLLSDSSVGSAEGLRIVSPVREDLLEKIEGIVGDCREYRLDLEVHVPEHFFSEKILIARHESDEEPMGHTFDLETRNYLRFYFYLGSLRAVLVELAADFAGWAVDRDGVEISLGGNKSKDLQDLVCEAIGGG